MKLLKQQKLERAQERKEKILIEKMDKELELKDAQKNKEKVIFIINMNF